MILTATFVAAETYDGIHRDDNGDPASAMFTLLFIGLFAWFDLRMAEILAGGAL